MYGSMEESPPAEAPALGPAELKAVRDAAPMHFNALRMIPCRDVSPDGDAWDNILHDIVVDGKKVEQKTSATRTAR